MENAAQAIDTVESIMSTDDDFMAELEAELNAESFEVAEIEEVSNDAAEEVFMVEEGNPEDILGLDITEEEALEELKATAKKGKAKTAEKAKAKKEAAADAAPAAPKRPSLSGLAPSAALRTAFGEKVYDYCITTQKQASMTAEQRKAAVDEFLENSLDTLAKKVKEKAINAFQSISGQAKLSVYTETAIQMLKDKKEFSCADLKTKYLARPYSPGTSSAQSSQMMMLLPALNIATRQGNKLVLVEDSPLFELLSNA